MWTKRYYYVYGMKKHVVCVIYIKFVEVLHFCRGMINR